MSWPASIVRSAWSIPATGLPVASTITSTGALISSHRRRPTPRWCASAAPPAGRSHTHPRPLRRLCESLELWGPGRAAAGVPASGLPARARGGRRVHRRRGPGRIRPRRDALLGLRDAGRDAGHRHAGQADRQRPSARRGGHHAGDRGVVRERDGVLQHLRRQPGLVRDRAGRARRDRGEGCRSARCSVGGRLQGGARRARRRGTRSSATCAAWACSWASSWSATARRWSRAARGRGLRRRAHEGPRHPASAPTARCTTCSRSSRRWSSPSATRTAWSRRLDGVLGEDFVRARRVPLKG